MMKIQGSSAVYLLNGNTMILGKGVQDTPEAMFGRGIQSLHVARQIFDGQASNHRLDRTDRVRSHGKVP